MNKNTIFKMIRKFCFLLAPLVFSVSSSFGAPSFGDRNNAPISTVPNQIEAKNVKLEPKTPSALPFAGSVEPPQVKGVEWLKIPYDQAENEVLGLFQKDVTLLEDKANELAIYEVRVSGQLPPNYQKSFRNKLERVFLTSKKLRLKQCTICDESRIYKTESGEIRYESYSTDPKRPSKVAGVLGVDRLIFSDLTYHTEDLVLRVRMVRPDTGDLIWSKEYSTADVVKSREQLKDSGDGELGHQDSLGRVLIGEIAFTTILSMGSSMYPSIDNGAGSELIGMPAIDFLIGERYDRGRRFFGFDIGAAIPMSTPEKGRPLPYILKVGPKMGYVFNPYNVSTARYSIAGELGAMISEGVTTGFFGFGPEVKLINRFGISLMPMYIIPRTVSGAENSVQQADGTFTSASSSVGKFGGFGFSVKATIQW